MEHDHARNPAWTYLLVALPAAVGAALGAIAYFGTDTGVDGTVGALLAFLGALAVTGGALLRTVAWRRRRALDVLLALGSVLTAFAAWMLMQDAFAVAMVLSVVALIAALAVPGRRAHA